MLNQIPTELQSLFQNEELFWQAVTHSSYAYENKRDGFNNEKLEFLGDSIIDFLLSEFLMEKYPLDNEGDLSKKRAALVNESVLAQLALKLKIDNCLRLGKGELQTGGIKKPRLLASALEAIVGALYQDSGFQVVKSFVYKHFGDLVNQMKSADELSFDFKTKLQEVIQAIIKQSPHYVLLQESGPSHEPIFDVEVRVQGQALARAQGKSKKMAEQKAASIALEFIKSKNGALS